ncbi:hypothetical protein B0T16DRAFT_406999 [Cercophora newfieldiana]|uniref:Uncharacterized protein n=1 Tax=Cercophora newfieldiana TaxID=92897 RepID=A0AA40CXL5_9PEZI|nr:hypothetical protein B0T16DRAFT_406999 [Cercophora newfieldiana]
MLRTPRQDRSSPARSQATQLPDRRHRLPNHIVTSSTRTHIHDVRCPVNIHRQQPVSQGEKDVLQFRYALRLPNISMSTRSLQLYPSPVHSGEMSRVGQGSLLVGPKRDFRFVSLPPFLPLVWCDRTGLPRDWAQPKLGPAPRLHRSASTTSKTPQHNVLVVSKLCCSAQEVSAPWFSCMEKLHQRSRDVRSTIHDSPASAWELPCHRCARWQPQQCFFPTLESTPKQQARQTRQQMTRPHVSGLRFPCWQQQQSRLQNRSQLCWGG